MADETLSRGRIRPPLRPFLPLVDLLAEFFGPNCEVVLHDFSRTQGTIVKIRNGHLSGRKVGGPISDFGLQMIRGLRDDPKASVLQLNYTSRGIAGRELKSSSMIIREGGKNIGALCINIDIEPLENLRHFLEGFCETRPTSRWGADGEEIFVPDFRNLMDEWLDKAMKSARCSPSLMTKQDKLHVLQSLEKQGVFLMRGAVREVSVRLGLAAPTIYKYLKEQQKTSRRKPARLAVRRTKGAIRA